jgi:hypothetical protein
MPSSSRRRARRTIDTSAYLAMCARVVTNGGVRAAEGDIDDFRQLLELRRVVDEAILDAVRGLRDAGVTWDELGAVSGHTRQAAIKKWNADL